MILAGNICDRCNKPCPLTPEDEYGEVVCSDCLQNKAEAELRWCGYCQSWHNKPCGEGCCWSPTDPTRDQMERRKHNRKHPLPVTFELMKMPDETMARLKSRIEG